MLPSPEAPLVSQRTHLLPLDGVRGLAILLVLGHHLVNQWRAPEALVVPVGIIARGWVGVDLFFALSGFLITGILLDARGAPRYFRTFYVRRVLRIWPLYAAILVALSIIALTATDGDGRRFLALWPWYWTHTLNFYIAANGWHVPFATDHFWSLAVEEQFYLVWPVLVAIVPRRAMPAACLTVVAGTAAARLALLLADVRGEPLVVLPYAHLDALALGGWLSAVLRSPEARARLAARIHAVGSPRGRRSTIAVLLLCEVPLLLAARHPATQLAARVLGPLLIAVPCVALVALVVLRPASVVGRALAARPWRALGRVSYGVYALHPLVILAVTGDTIVPTDRQVALRLVAIGLSIALAALSWRFLEAPVLRLKERWAPAASGLERGPGALATAPRAAAA